MNAPVLFGVFALSFVAPHVASGQGSGARFVVQGAFGTDVSAGGDNQSFSVGFSATERLDFLISAERFHWPTEETRSANYFSARRGGTTRFVSVDVRYQLFTFHRISPYVLASAGRGISRPNVNNIFPDPVTNDAGLMFLGGGGRIAVTGRLSGFVDIRFGIQGERDSFVGLAPIRGGVAFRF